MLQLKGIKKTYDLGGIGVEALRGVDVSFRESEFVSILGPSGCGKTTLLNIIGGLDQYTSGDLVINGISTREFSDRDWDSYRNHSIGFVFQSYNLIPHQSVLANVELALTLSGISKTERRRRAKEVLERVGLGDQIKKRPNQLSGGQMQRVAIARALINDPDILLADEPTGALDSETSVQIMELLKEISDNKLIIMVTHNPELAEKYSSRIIKLLDGEVIDDSMPYEPSSEEIKANSKNAAKGSKTSMSSLTAASLSLNNLMTKKARTFLTAFAGSIGIIGIALILSLSTGIQAYIDKVQEDTLSSYPVTIEKETVDLSTLMETVTGSAAESMEHEQDAVYSNVIMYDLLNSMITMETDTNNLKDFKTYIESDESGIDEYISSVAYSYDLDLNIYSADTSDEIYRINPSSVFDDIGPQAVMSETSEQQGLSAMASNPIFSTSSSYVIWQELMTDKNGEGLNELLYEQYDVLYGRWPENYDELILVVNENNELYDLVLYSLGLKDSDELPSIMESILKGETVETEVEKWTYEDICSLGLKLVLPSDYYRHDAASDTWIDMRDNETYMKYVVDSGIDLKIVGVVKPNEDAVATAISGSIGYTHELTEYYIEQINNSEIVKQQKTDTTTDVISGLLFDDGSADNMTNDQKAADVQEYFSSLSADEMSDIYTEIMSVPSEEVLEQYVAQYMMQYPDRQSREVLIAQAYSEQAEMDSEAIESYMADMTDEEIEETMVTFIKAMVEQEYMMQTQQQLSALSAQQKAGAFKAYLAGCDAARLAELYDKYMPAVFSEMTYEDVLKTLGAVDINDPSKINIYAATFEAKDGIAEVISNYNKGVEDADKISYTDYVAIMMSSITTIINAISYVLIAFVAISLVVSSIMIGIITYISVLERTKEIGILRAVGASKKDISRVFNAETLIVGFSSGIIGIGLTLLLCIPINAIIRALSGIPNLGAQLPVGGAIILVVISMLLTLIAGIIPARIAARKDPVEALRTE